MENLFEAMEIVAPGTKWISIDDSYEKLTMLDGSTKPTLLELQGCMDVIDAENLKKEKKLIYEKYCSSEILPFQLSESNLIDITKNNLIILNEKMNGWNELNESIQWLENDEWITITKAQLQEILNYAETKKQEKFEEIFMEEQL